MSRTYIQQYQISGSLSADISDVVSREDLVKADRSIIDDLNSLRTQVKGILGESAWTAEQAIDLHELKAQLTGSLSANSGSFAGDFSVAGETTLASAIVSDLTDTRVVFAGASGALVDDADMTFASSTLSIGGTNNSGKISVKDGAGNERIEINGDQFVVAVRDDSGNYRSFQATDVFGVVGTGNVNGPAARMTNTGIELRNPSNSGFATIELASAAGSATFGGPVAGSVSIKNASDAQTIGLDGATGDATFAGNADVNGTLDVAGQVDLAASAVATNVRGTLSVAEETTLASAIVSDLTDTRVVFAGAAGALVDHDSLTFVSDPIAYRSTLAIGGTDRGGIVSVSDSSDVEAIKLDGAGGSLQLIYDNQSRFYADSMGLVQLKDSSGSTKINLNGADGSASVEKISIANDVAQRLYVVDADGSMKDEEYLTFDGATFAIDGYLSVSSNADLNGTLDVAGQVDLAAAGVATSVRGTLAVAEDATFAGNVQVDGDLRVKGSMTYIDTQNVRVQDAFIYLATGSLGSTDSGIVLHGGAGVDMDLVIGQDGGAGEFIFGKADRSPDGEGAMDGIDLVQAWASGIKLGLAESALSGSLAVDSADVKLSAVEDLKFEAHGNVIKLGSDAEFDSFVAQFGAGASLLGALGAGSGIGISFRKGNINGSAASLVSGKSQLPISSVGALRNVSDKTLGLDVYLNGVLMSLGVDYTVSVVDRVDFEFALQGDDLVTVVLRNAVV